MHISRLSKISVCPIKSRNQVLICLFQSDDTDKQSYQRNTNSNNVTLAKIVGEGYTNYGVVSPENLTNRHEEIFLQVI
jgi:hypothetical protein